MVCLVFCPQYVQVTVSTLFFYCEEPIRMVYHLEVPLSDIDFVQNITGSGSVDVSKSLLEMHLCLLAWQCQEDFGQNPRKVSRMLEF